MGLGARRNQGDECTGLDALQDLLSRLNGRSDEAVGEDRRKREDTKISRYLNRKVGTMRFVFGGLLVGDKVQELADSLKEKDQGAAKVPGQGGDASSSSSEEEEEEESAASVKKEKKSKKRKSEDGDTDHKKAKKSKKRKADDADEDSKSRRKEKKDKKRRKEAGEDDESSPGDADEASAARKKSKKEKKEKRRKSKDDDENSTDASDSQSKKKEKKRKRKADKTDDGETTKSSTPTVSGISTPISGSVPVPHRHLARSRFIAQKRAAVMDQAALNQIFMIKA